MAFNIDPSIALKVNTPQQMSLADMLSVARGAQDYKQRQKLNPIELQQAQSVLEQNLAAEELAKKTLQPKIQQQQYITESAGTQLNTQQLENTKKHAENLIQNISTLITKPDLTRDDIVKRATELNKNAGGNEQSLNQTLSGLPEKGSVNDYRAWLAQGLTRSVGALGQIEKLAPAGVYSTQLPQVETLPVTENTPKGANENAPVTPNTLKGNMENMNKPAHSQPSQLPYPVRTPTTITPYGPTEKVDQDAGFKNRNILVDRQANLTTDRRNLNEAKQVAKELEKEEWAQGAGFPGMVGRNLSTFLGTEMGIKYKQLSKDLANVQISNIQAKGGSLDTVAGQQLTRMANGDETYPPKVLLNIINRAQADMTELDLKATAAQKFSQGFGDNNFKAFQQMWSKNADSKIFELYNIAKDPDLTAKDKEAAKARLFPKGEKERKVFIEKYMNIKKLEETGSL
jgi:hypothetical protein